MCAGSITMNSCPVCKGTADIQSPDWDGGRMTVDCIRCGKFGIGHNLYDELLPLPDTDWRMKRLRLGIREVSEPKMIWKPLNNIVEVASVCSDKPTKLQKRYLRAKAEGRTVTGGIVYKKGGEDDESGT